MYVRYHGTSKNVTLLTVIEHFIYSYVTYSRLLNSKCVHVHLETSGVYIFFPAITGRSFDGSVFNRRVCGERFNKSSTRTTSLCIHGKKEFCLRQHHHE